MTTGALVGAMDIDIKEETMRELEAHELTLEEEEVGHTGRLVVKGTDELPVMYVCTY